MNQALALKSSFLALDGEFELLNDSSLLYYPKKLPESKNPITENHKIKIIGKWEIDPYHDLLFHVDESLTERFGRRIKFKGEFLKAEAGELDFTYQHRKKEGRLAVRTFRFFGKWKADKNNRLTFVLNNSKGETQTLILNGAWKFNKRHEIVYTYRKQVLKTKTKRTKRLVFRGKWVFRQNRSFSYVLDGDTGQAFRFRATYETPILLANKNEIRFQIGIEVTGRRYSKTRTIILFGKWKLKRDLSLTFEVERNRAQAYEIQFQARYRINKEWEVEAALFGESEGDAGLSFTLRKAFVEAEGEAFLTLEKSLARTDLELGGKIRF